MTKHNDDWVADRLAEAIPKVQLAVVCSADGLVTGKSERLDRDMADTFAAGASGMMSTALALVREFGKTPATIYQQFVHFDGGILFLQVAADGTRIGVITDEDADPGLVAEEMRRLVEQLGKERLSTAARAVTADHGQPG